MRRVATGWALLLMAATSAIGQDKPAADKAAAERAAADRALAEKMLAEHDKRVATAIFETVKEGVDLYNSGNVAGCQRLYQGSLTALATVLDYRPETAKGIRAALTTAKGQSPTDAAFTLRNALNAAQSDVTPLWFRLGGQKAVEAVVHDFVDVAAKDPKVNFLRDGQYKLDAAGVKKLEGQLVSMISQYTGGPGVYQGKSMKDAHKGMKITEAEFNALAADLVATLEKYKVGKVEIEQLLAVVANTKGDIVEVK